MDMGKTESSSTLVANLVDAAFRMLQHDSSESDPQYVFMRSKLEEVFSRILNARDSHEPKEDQPAQHSNRFQDGVKPWLLTCFGAEIANNRIERNHRFLEEALELVQACGCSREHAHQIVDYVYGRPVGEPFQEVGGVMVTLAALCLANGLNMHDSGDKELERVWAKMDAIREKQARKIKDSALPGAGVSGTEK